VDKTEGDNKMPVDVPLGGEAFRRSLYIQVRRSRPLAMLTTFDAPVMELNCERRSSSTVAPQALMLMNSQFVLEQVARFADRVARDAGTERKSQIERAWQLAFARAPSDRELRESDEFLSGQVQVLARQQTEPTPAPSTGAAKPAKTAPPAIAPESQALRDLCQALLSANEFLYVD